MIDIFSTKLIDKCFQKSPWDLGNRFLYNLCADNFTHDTDEKIIAKVWLIGRSYAAAIERRKTKVTSGDINDNFYTETVVKTFKDPKIDKHLLLLSEISLNENEILTILKTHRYLIDIIYKITKLEKRSFCSKYLHFHLPELFFLFDTRAVSALRQFNLKLTKQMEELIELETVDKEYGRFFCKCYLLQQDIYKKTGTLISPRQLDNLLIHIANEKLQIINHQ
jgi:hypothetical protein